MRMSIRSGQRGYGALAVRSTHVLRPDGYTRDWHDPVGPWTDLGPRLFAFQCWSDRAGSTADAVYDSIPDDGRAAVEVEYC